MGVEKNLENSIQSQPDASGKAQRPLQQGDNLTIIKAEILAKIQVFNGQSKIQGTIRAAEHNLLQRQ